MSTPATDVRSCAGRKHPLTYVGIRDFRGALAGASEDLLRVALYGCSSCGRLEMFLPPSGA